MVSVKYIGKNDDEIDFYNGKNYECIGIGKGEFKWLLIIDESKEDFSYPPYLFELVEEEWQNEEEKILADRVKKRIEEDNQQT